MKPMHIDFNGQRLTLLPDRAIWWPEQETLLVADVHIGKGTSFRQRGMAVPTGSSAATLNRLGVLVQRHRAKRLIILGDFLHALLDRAVTALIDDWCRSLRAVEIMLVLGNHDRALERQSLPGLRTTATAELSGIELLHDSPAGGQAAICGHLHPYVRLSVDRSDQLRVPVFWVHGQQLVLPAFGEFTGGQLVQPQADDRVYAVVETTVTDVSAIACAWRRPLA